MVSTGGIDHSAHQCGVVGVDPIAPMCTDWSPVSAVTAIDAASTHAITRNAKTRERFTSRSWHQTQARDDRGLQQTDALGQMAAAPGGWPAAPYRRRARTAAIRPRNRRSRSWARLRAAWSA